MHSHLKKDPDSQIAYQFNRYLNLCHVLIYHGCNESLDFELKDLKACGLIQTKQELEVLELIDTYENKLRQGLAVISWMGRLFQKCVDNGNIDKTHCRVFIQNLFELRGYIIGAQADAATETPALSWAVTMVCRSMFSS